MVDQEIHNEIEENIGRLRPSCLYAQQDQRASENPRDYMGVGPGVMGDGGYSCMMGGMMTQSMMPTFEGGVLNGDKSPNMMAA